MAGYFLLMISEHIVLVLVATAVRSMGSSCMWIYSTLILQLQVPNALLGRILALEMAMFTITDTASGLFGGVAYDVLGLSTRQVCAIMTVLAGVVTLLWVAYTAVEWRKHNWQQTRGLGSSTNNDEHQTLAEA
jgi:predicted MFS family arabinose efflux permease